MNSVDIRILRGLYNDEKIKFFEDKTHFRSLHHITSEKGNCDIVIFTKENIEIIKLINGVKYKKSISKWRNATFSKIINLLQKEKWIK